MKAVSLVLIFLAISGVALAATTTENCGGLASQQVVQGSTCPPAGTPIYIASAGFSTVGSDATISFTINAPGYAIYVGEDCAARSSSYGLPYRADNGASNEAVTVALNPSIGGSYIIALYPLSGTTSCSYSVTTGSITYNSGKSAGCNAFAQVPESSLDIYGRGFCADHPDSYYIGLAVGLPILGGIAITTIVAIIIVKKRRDYVHKRLSNRLSTKYEGSGNEYRQV